MAPTSDDGHRGWELPAPLAREAGEEAMAGEFDAAHAEMEHDRRVKTWLDAMVRAQAGTR